ncbi:MAG: amidohydrolase family protein [Solirubrobacteraceae bacterium]|nr:amidohydrolase family protein [Solirubrobacteraceae bacterium]
MCEQCPDGAEHQALPEAEPIDECGRVVPRHAVSRRSLLAGAGAAAVPLALGTSEAGATFKWFDWWRRKPRPTNPGRRGHYLLKGGAVVSVDPAIGTQANLDVLIKDGVIVGVGTGLRAYGAEVIDASKMIVMPGFVETHYHMWSALGRNFVGDGFEYFPAKSATVAAYEPQDFYNSITLGLAELAAAGITTVNNWAHNVRGPEYADAELAAHRDVKIRARYSYGHRDGQPSTQPIDFADIDRVQKQWFGPASPFEGLVHLGVNLRGPSNMANFQTEMAFAKSRKLPVSVHSGQGPTTAVKAAELEALGVLGPEFLLCHNLPATPEDRAAMVRAGTPLSLAPHSEMRLGTAGGFHGQLLKSLKDGVTISLSFDASSLAPIDMFQSMNVAWNIGIPWIGSDTEGFPPVLLTDAIKMATLNGAKALGLDKITGSITPGKRADVIMIRQDDLNMAPACDIESAVVRVATPANVDTVFVDGRILKRNKQLVGLDVPDLVREAAKSAHAVRTRAGGRLTPATSTPPQF